jgi:hypothetical protein
MLDNVKWPVAIRNAASVRVAVSLYCECTRTLRFLWWRLSMAYGRSTLHLIANEDLDRGLLNSIVTSRVRGPTLKSFTIRAFARYFHAYQIKEGDTGGTCSTHGIVNKYKIKWNLMIWVDFNFNRICDYNIKNSGLSMREHGPRSAFSMCNPVAGVSKNKKK